MSKVYQYNFNNSISNDNGFTKKLRSLKKYCPQAYKFAIFKFKDNYLNVEDGEYSINLPTSMEFKFVYGQIKLIYQVANKVIKFIDLEPSDFFMDGYRFDLEVYKSIYCRNAKDKFKIDLMLEMKRRKNK
nr:MAG TPA: hypothetical protein [Caudoviricetes sp.]